MEGRGRRCGEDLTSTHELITGALIAIMVVILAFSGVLGITAEAMAGITTTLGAAAGWLFRGRINGVQSRKDQ